MSRVILGLVLLNTIVSFTSLFLVYRQGTAQEVAPLPVIEDGAAPQVQPLHLDELSVIPVNKIIVSIAGDSREHYFVLDLSLYGVSEDDAKQQAKIEPLVRNSVVSALSAKAFQNLRGQSISALQQELAEVIQHDFARLGIAVPFSHVLINRLVVQ